MSTYYMRSATLFTLAKLIYRCVATLQTQTLPGQFLALSSWSMIMPAYTIRCLFGKIEQRSECHNCLSPQEDNRISCTDDRGTLPLQMLGTRCQLSSMRRGRSGALSPDVR